MTRWKGRGTDKTRAAGEHRRGSFYSRGGGGERGGEGGERAGVKAEDRYF